MKEEKIIEEVKVENVAEEKKGFSIASLVLGICSLIFWSWGLIDIACGVCAVIFGKKGMELSKQGMAKAGFILGIISLSIWAFIMIFAILTGAVLSLTIFSFL